MNFTPIDTLGKVEGFCLVKSATVKASAKGDNYLDLTLGDADGEINAKLWKYSENEHGAYKVGDIVKVRGVVSQYNNADQLKIERIRQSLPSDGVSLEDLVKTCAYSSEQMFDELFSLANSFEDSELRAMVTAIYNDNRLNLLYWPAAFSLHHALRGGLLMHTLSIVRLAQAVADIYPFADKELLLAGAMLHDIAKIDEFIVDESGVAEGYSVEGNLVGHLVMGAEKIGAYAEKLKISPRTATLLKHMVVSHHGVPEFGACVMPMFIEAEILSELDLMDARIYEMRETVAATTPEEFSGRVWALDNRKLFNHGRMDLNKEPKLF